MDGQLTSGHGCVIYKQGRLITVETEYTASKQSVNKMCVILGQTHELFPSVC